MVGGDVRQKAPFDFDTHALCEMVSPRPIPFHHLHVHFGDPQPAAHPRFCDLLLDLCHNVFWAQQVIAVAETAGQDSPELILVTWEFSKNLPDSR